VTHLTKIPRPEKRTIARKIHDLLVARQAAGPAEPALDAFVPELSEVGIRLDTHVGGTVAASTAWQVQLGRLEDADVNVDTWLRHIESFLFVEANRRSGPNVTASKAVYAAACPDGLAHVDDRVVEQNAHCRTMLSVLRDPENAPALAAIDLPGVWLDRFEAALDESDAASDDVIAARTDRSTHVGLGRDAEVEWVDLMTRIQRHVGSRARRDEVAKKMEGKALLQPLLAAVQKLRADAAARATRREKTTPETPDGAAAPEPAIATP
jgi:hypothetical protein